MPCFKGLAVSIHTPDGPLPEYSVQRQSRLSRISSFIRVPPPKIPDPTTGKAEQSTFAISVTLLTPGLNVPYSTPTATPENPNPQPKIVSGLPGHPGGSGSIGPYLPMTASPNETVAAYIYFDGRQKEEVATLLRRGEETWVNSRWVGVPESEGGGLAEREFLFREVGLERWLNGLDLDGKDAAQKIERRRQKMEKRRRRRESARQAKGDGDTDMDIGAIQRSTRRRDVLRYGDNAQSPVEDLSDDDDDEVFSSDPEAEDDDPIPETAGQIKIALFRVLASGQVRRGEYSPQFDAHEDDDEQGAQNGGSGNDGGDVDHTTSFAKPKTLDPKSISTQTVTGIDPTDKPYATFTFMYRGERQLQKLGILKRSKSQDKETPTPAKRKSGQPDFANLGPLKPGGTVGFVNFRDGNKPSKATKKPKKGDKGDMESDDEEEEDEDDNNVEAGKDEAETDKGGGDSQLSPDELRQQGELAESLRQIKLKRQHSAEPLSDVAGGADPAQTSQPDTPTRKSTPPAQVHGASTPPGSSGPKQETNLDELDKSAFVGSPLKKQRASVSGTAEESIRKRMGGQLAAGIKEVMNSTATDDRAEETRNIATESVGAEKSEKTTTKNAAEIDDEL